MEGYYTHIGSGLYRLPSQTPRSQNWRHLHTLTPGWVFTGDEFDSRIQQPWWWQCSLKTRLSWYAFVCLFMPSSSLEANWSFCLVLFWNSLLLYRPGQPQNPGNPPALDATPGLMANCARAQEVQSKQHQIPNVSVNIPDTEKNKKNIHSEVTSMFGELAYWRSMCHASVRTWAESHVKIWACHGGVLGIKVMGRQRQRNHCSLLDSQPSLLCRL